MFILVTISMRGFVTRHAAFASYDEAVKFAYNDQSVYDSVWLVEYVEEDEDLFYSINR